MCMLMPGRLSTECVPTHGDALNSAAAPWGLLGLRRSELLMRVSLGAMLYFDLIFDKSLRFKRITHVDCRISTALGVFSVLARVKNRSPSRQVERLNNFLGAKGALSLKKRRIGKYRGHR